MRWAVTLFALFFNPILITFLFLCLSAFSLYALLIVYFLGSSFQFSYFEPILPSLARILSCLLSYIHSSSLFFLIWYPSHPQYSPCFYTFAYQARVSNYLPNYTFVTSLHSKLLDGLNLVQTWFMWRLCIKQNYEFHKGLTMNWFFWKPPLSQCLDFHESLKFTWMPYYSKDNLHERQVMFPQSHTFCGGPIYTKAKFQQRNYFHEGIDSSKA